MFVMAAAAIAVATVDADVILCFNSMDAVWSSFLAFCAVLRSLSGLGFRIVDTFVEKIEGLSSYYLGQFCLNL